MCIRFFAKCIRMIAKCDAKVTLCVRFMASQFCI